MSAQSAMSANKLPNWLNELVAENDRLRAENDRLRADNDHLKSLVSDDVGAVMAPEILEDRLNQRQNEIIKKLEAELYDFQTIADTYGHGNADGLDEYCEAAAGYED